MEAVSRIVAGEADLSRELREKEAQPGRRDEALRRVFSKAGASYVPALLDAFARKLAEAGGPPVNDALREMSEKGTDDPSTHGLAALFLQVLRETRPAWVRKEMVGGKLKKADNVATLFQHLRRKVRLAGEGKSLKVFRKTSATRLKSRKDYRGLRHFFLGHSDRTITDRHYAA
jgi:hypothetical protein